MSPTVSDSGGFRLEHSAQVKDLSEREVLDLILPVLMAGESPVSGGEIGPGDDAAFVVPRAAGGFLVSVDALVEGQDFLWTWPNGREHRPEDVGYKSMAQNLSDINAMGGVPRHVFVSLQFPRTTTTQRLIGIARGMREALDALAPECRVGGGDLGIASELTSTVTVMGEPTGGLPVRRSGALPGHVLAVAGRLGWASAGLEILFGDRANPAGSTAAEALVEAQMRPAPPMAAGPEAAAAGASAMMDVSDGLVRDAYRMARASGVRIALDERRLDDLAARLPGEVQDPLRHVLAGGEDFAVLAAFPSGQVPEHFAPVGSIRVLGRDGQPGVLLGEKVIPESGFDHFHGG